MDVMTLKKKLLKVMTAAIWAILYIGWPAGADAHVQQPATAIDKILEYRSGLNLTDAQVRKWSTINATLTEKMVEAKHQADLRKQEIDEFTSNWSSMHGTAVDHLIKEYFDFMTQLKLLELVAISKAGAVLNAEQLRKFSGLSSIETMMLKFENQLAGTF